MVTLLLLLECDDDCCHNTALHWPGSQMPVSYIFINLHTMKHRQESMEAWDEEIHFFSTTYPLFLRHLLCAFREAVAANGKNVRCFRIAAGWDSREAEKREWCGLMMSNIMFLSALLLLHNYITLPLSSSFSTPSLHLHKYTQTQQASSSSGKPRDHGQTTPKLLRFYSLFVSCSMASLDWNLAVWYNREKKVRW